MLKRGAGNFKSPINRTPKFRMIEWFLAPPSGSDSQNRRKAAHPETDGEKMFLMFSQTPLVVILTVLAKVGGGGGIGLLVFKIECVVFESGECAPPPG